MVRRVMTVSFAWVFVSGIVLAAAGSDWPRFLGPKGTGISAESDWSPASLNAAPKILWKAAVGNGYSSVSVVGDHLYTMGNKSNQDTVYCLDVKTGKEVWHHSYPCGEGQYQGPRATPTVEDDRVYTVGREGQLFCLDAKTGTVKWQKNIHTDFQANPPGWGHAASVCIEGNLLILNAATAGLALDKKTGDKVWASAPGTGGYATPVVFDAGGKRCAAIFGQKALYCVDVKDGRPLWSYPWETSYDVNAAAPIVFDKKVFITSGYGKGCVLLDFAAGKPKVAWQSNKMASHFSTGVLMGGYLYGVDGNAGQPGQLRCIDAKTGQVKWSEKVGFGGLMAAAGKLIVLNEHGELYIVEATPQGYKQIAKSHSLLGKNCWTAPVLCGGHIYCRNHTGELVCVDVSK